MSCVQNHPFPFFDVIYTDRNLMCLCKLAEKGSQMFVVVVMKKGENDRLKKNYVKSLTIDEGRSL